MDGIWTEEPMEDITWEKITGEGVQCAGPQKNDLIKLVAVLSMLIDHIGMVFFPTATILRLLGRVAFPLFAYQLGISWRCTRSKSKLALRILVFGIITQPAFYFLVGGWNVMFTLLYCLGMFWVADHWGLAGKILAFLLAVGTWKLRFMDCAVFGPICAFGYYVFPIGVRDKKTLAGLVYQAVTTFLLCMLLNVPLQIYQLAALLLILCPCSKQYRIPKYFFYIFYPAHLYLFWGLRVLL